MQRYVFGLTAKHTKRFVFEVIERIIRNVCVTRGRLFTHLHQVHAIHAEGHKTFVMVAPSNHVIEPFREHNFHGRVHIFFRARSMPLKIWPILEVHELHLAL